MGKKKVYIMVGAPGSGKTTWITKYNAARGSSAHISRDAVRFRIVKENEPYFSREKEVYNAFCYEIYAALCASWVKDVYVDATHLTKASRKKIVRELSSRYATECYDIIPVVFRPSLETCLERNAKRQGRECVPESALTNMYNSYEDPAFDDIKYETIIYAEECE